jgi:hypothetical protein
LLPERSPLPNRLEMVAARLSLLRRSHQPHTKILTTGLLAASDAYSDAVRQIMDIRTLSLDILDML